MLSRMRTTVTLEPDAESLVRQDMEIRKISFKVALNDAIRSGLRPHAKTERRFTQRTYSLGGEANFNIDKALAFADSLEDEEILRKLAVRK